MSARPDIEEAQRKVDSLARAFLARSCTAGQISVAFDLKDGQWVPGRVSYTFPRQFREHNSTLSGGRSDDPVPDSRKGRQ